MLLIPTRIPDGSLNVRRERRMSQRSRFLAIDGIRLINLQASKEEWIKSTNMAMFMLCD